eukprot:10039382-Alexandrium_andersonii.AAC.1
MSTRLSACTTGVWRRHGGMRCAWRVQTRQLRRPKTAARRSRDGPPHRAGEPLAGLSSVSGFVALLGRGQDFSLLCSRRAGLPAARPHPGSILAAPPWKRPSSSVHVGRALWRLHGGGTCCRPGGRWAR